jgi:hypothetical protein
MTIPEITAYVMALPVEELRRLTATEIMGWAIWRPGIEPIDDPRNRLLNAGQFVMYQKDWRPDIDRNQSRQVTDKLPEKALIDLLVYQLTHYWWKRTPDQETRAALIAHMIHKETTT